jgi:hypothetical protein
MSVPAVGWRNTFRFGLACFSVNSTCPGLDANVALVNGPTVAAPEPVMVIAFKLRPIERL